MKHYIVGDIHGNYTALREALARENFNEKEDMLVVLGDLFDRGTQSKEVWDYICSLPNHICVRGNHDLILLDVLRRGFLYHIDQLNGISSTVASFTNCTKEQAEVDVEKIVRMRATGIEEWIKYDMIWYYETANYIFVHGWIPDSYYLHGDLSKCTDDEWENAVWGNTEKQIKKHIAAKYSFHKTLVFGHWHASLLHESFPDGKNGDTIWTNKNLNLIGLDTCTARSNYLGVLVIDEQ